MLPTEKDKLKKILNTVVSLGDSTLQVNQDIMAVLKNGDFSSELNKVEKPTKQERYQKIDEVDNLIITVFALYTPEARDLRELVAFLKITNEFDRISNSCNSFIRDFPKAMENSEIDKDSVLEYAIPLQKSAISALQSALKLLKLEDKQLIEEHYQEVVVEESKNDDLYKIVEKTLLKKIKKDVYLSKEYQNILEALRRIEKVADRALSIANLLHYAKIGGEISKV